MLRPVIVHNEDDKISIQEKLGKIAGILATAPPFDFRSKQLVQRKRNKIKVFVVTLIIGSATYFNIRYNSYTWEDHYNLYLISDLSIITSLIMTVEALLGSLFRKQDWKNYFIECTLLTQETISPAEIHFYKNIYHYLGLFMAINIFGLLKNYALIMKCALPSKEYLVVITGVGDLLLIFYNSLQKFIINTFLLDIKIRYDFLNSQISTQKFLENKESFFEVIKKIETNALQLHKVTCLLSRIFEYQFLSMIMFAFCCSIELCLFMYNYSSLETNLLFLLFLVSKLAGCVLVYLIVKYLAIHYTLFC